LVNSRSQSGLNINSRVTNFLTVFRTATLCKVCLRISRFDVCRVLSGSFRSYQELFQPLDSSVTIVSRGSIVFFF
jgi:hypothetical protein